MLDDFQYGSFSNDFVMREPFPIPEIMNSLLFSICLVSVMYPINTKHLHYVYRVLSTLCDLQNVICRSVTGMGYQSNILSINKICLNLCLTLKVIKKCLKRTLDI